MKIAKAVWMCVALVAAHSGCAVEKSENPLSPTVAGPIAGVEISSPRPLEPTAGEQISGDRQPITLLLENAWSNGQRPLSYVFEVATDAAFNNKVFVREGVQPGDNGRTALRLPDALGTGRGYYWRAKAEDGANAGPYSAPTTFNLLTPLAFDKPSPLSPVGNERVSSEQPEFRWTNASRVGTPIEVSYVVEVATTDSFATKLVVWQYGEQPNETRVAAGSALPGNMQLFWRVRAFQGGTVGPWSDTQLFRTPVPIVVAPPPTPGPAGGSCASQPGHLQVVECRRKQFGQMDPAQLNQFLRLVAADLTNGNHAGGPFGILEKPSGNQCLGYSCDIICASSGRIWDTLADSEGAQDPIWADKGSSSSRCEIQR